jgi:PAS domain S-box-containing protein
VTSSQISKILIVDDQPDIIRALMEVLKKDYVIIAATTPQQARKLAHKEPQPDLILMDVMMPEMSGYDLCAEFKGNPATQHIPIIFLTALHEPKEEAKGFQVGGADYIIKPADPVVLKARIQNHLTIERLIEQQNQTKQALAQANQQLQAVLNAVPGMVSWISRDLKYLGCNQHLAATYQLQPADFVGQPVGFREGPFNFRDIVQDFFAQPDKTAFHEISIGPENLQEPYYIVAQKYDEGNAAVFVGINVAEREQAKAALRHSETRFRDLVEQMNDWVWETNADSEFIYSSPKSTEIIGYDAEALLGKQFTDLMPPNEAVRFNTILSHFIQTLQSFTQIEVNCRHQNGHSLVLEISGSPIFNLAGKFQGYRGVARDVTERKQVEIDIRKALTKEKELNELKTRFISMASHEFRTPLTTIMASAESLERYRHKFSDEKQKIILKRIQDSVSYVTSLLNDVLTAGKADAGKFAFQPTSMNLRTFCLDLIEEVQIIQPAVQPEENESQIQFQFTGEHEEGEFDETLLRHILGNLLTNALKYSPDKATVNFTVATSTDSVVFEVSDQGIGIPPADQEHLFQAFHRASNVGNISGTGLGLMIAKQATQAHQGTIEYSSEPNAGTTFVVTLPFMQTRSTHD